MFILLTSCSFDNKTGIWTGEEKEERKISKIGKEQKQITNVVNVYSTDSIYSKEKTLTKSISLSNSNHKQQNYYIFIPKVLLLKSII